MIKVLLVDDQNLVRQGVQALLELADGIEVIGEAQGGKEAMKMDFDVREVGRIQSIREFLVIAVGLPSCINGQIVEFKGGHLGVSYGI